MSAAEMLHHLTTGMRLSIASEGVEILVPEEKWPAAKNFLMGPKPMPKGFEKPAAYHLHPMPSHQNFDDLKAVFFQTIATLQDAVVQENFKSRHPNFGILNGTETLHLHYKHITHHFTQFGLMQPVAEA
jgi:oxepin-CoA hydrolase/3-oxo-5,6-dehydrosuberyl-CoA semialdehyde dehydrogenase